MIRILPVLFLSFLPWFSLAAGANVSGVKIKAFDIQKRLELAIRNGKQTVVIPAGEFHLRGSMNVIGARDLTIKGAGVNRTRLIFPSPGGGVSIQRSTGIKLDDFSVDFSPLPFTEGVITYARRIAGDRWLVEFTIAQGYPPITRDQRDSPYMFYFFDERSKLELEHTVMIRGKVQVLNPMKGRLFAAARVLKPGDYIVLKQQKLAGFALRLYDASNIDVENVAINSSPSLAVAARYVGGNNNFSYTIVPGPAPAGARLERLISTNADGMQWFWSPGSVTFDNCNFGGMGDDGIHIRSFAAKIVAINNSKSVVIEDPLAEDLFTKPFGLYASRRDVSVEQAGDRKVLGHTHVSAAEEIEMSASKSIGGAGQEKKHYARLSFEFPLPSSAKPGDLISFENLNPTHYLIENSAFHGTRARGLLLQASNGMVKNSRFYNIGLSAIEARLEGPYDCCHVDSVTIADNDIRHVAFGLIVGRADSTHLGAINIADPRYRVGVVSHRNILIEGNNIDGSGVAGVFADATDGISIVDNQLSNTNLDAGSVAGHRWGRNAGGAITVMNSEAVRVDGNRISNIGPYALAPIRITGSMDKL